MEEARAAIAAYNRDFGAYDEEAIVPPSTSFAPSTN